MPKSPQRYAQLARAVKILALLEQSRYGLTVAELLADVVRDMGLASLHPKSVRRDVQFLQDAGFPLDCEDGERGRVWKLGKNYRTVPVQSVSVLELLAFSAGRELLVPLAGTPYWQGIESLWCKLREALPGAVWEHFERQRPGLIVRGGPARSYADKDGILSGLNRAIQEHRLLEVVYQSPKKGKGDPRSIEPHALVVYHGSIYLLAAVPGEEGFRLYKLDRLDRATVLDKRFRPRPGAKLEELFADSIGVFQGDEPCAVEVRCDASVARWVVEAPFHPRQVVEELPDGGLLICIARAYEAEIVPRVLSLGASAEILAPESARERVRQTVAQLAERYGPPANTTPKPKRRERAT